MSEYQGIGFHETTSIPADLFILNPMRQHLVTGRRNYGYLWSRFGWGGVFLTLFVLLMVGIGMPRVITEMRLATMKTISTEARVSDHRITHGKSTSYYLRYDITVKGQTYSQEESVSSSEYNDHPIGDYVQATYVVDDPSTSHLGGSGINWGSIFYLPIMAVILLVIGIGWWIQTRPMRLKLQHLKRDGQLIFGQLKSSRGELIRRGSGKNRRTDYDVSIYCQFTNPSGKKIDAHATYTRNDLKKKDLQTTGAIAVLYVNDADYMVL